MEKRKAFGIAGGLFVLLLTVLLACGVAFAADSGGYGAAPAQSSGGYGAAPAQSSGGYGAAPAAKPADTGGYGAAPAAKPADTGGYGAAPAAKPADTGGYGEEKAAPAEPAPAAPVMTGPKPVTIGFIVTGLAIGIAVGFVLQRGRFCMNTAFRDIIFIKDYRYFRASLIALMVMIVGANILNDMGIVPLVRQPIWYLAQTTGGYLFGIGMVLAGGCGSGILYRVGEGLLAAVVAVLGFFIGIAMTSHGILKPIFDFLRSFTFEFAGQPAPALWHVVGDGPTIKWAVIAVLVVIMGIYVLKGNPFKVDSKKGIFWSVSGLIIGILGVITFWASYRYEGFPRGLSFTTPLRDAFFTVLTGSSQAPPPFQMNRLGFLSITWPAFYVIGVPLGAFISAKIYKEFKWKCPPAEELLTVFMGSLLMGFGATLGGGCNVGQALTGFSTLSIGSIIGSIAIVLGNWTMVYFKFIKPMNDLDA